MESYSYSALKLFSHCAYDWKIQYIDKLKQKPTPALIYGRAVHDAQEYYNRLNAVGVAPKKEDVGSIIEKHIDAYKSIDEKERESLKSYGRCALDNIVDNDKYIVEQSEKTFKVPFYNFFLKGRIDGITQDWKIYELKTSSRKYDLDVINENHQRIIYEIAFRLLFGRPSNGIVYKVIYKRKKPTTDFIETTVTDEEIEMAKKWMLKQVLGIRKCLETNNFPKSKNCKFNNYKDMCFYREHCNKE